MIEKIYAAYLACHKQVVIDSRKITAGCLFVAVGRRDEWGRHKGNEWARQAVEELGAGAALINDPELWAAVGNDPRYICVPDCELALQRLATHHRQRWGKTVLAIGGSNGKTTTKELITNVLNKEYNAFATQGNLNNHLGLPLTLLSLREEHDLAIIEIGANHMGETAALAAIAAPNYGLVTNCGKDHLGEYGSLENIVRGNAELYDYLAANSGVAFVCTDDATLIRVSSGVSQRNFYGSGQRVWAQVTQAPILGLELHFGEARYAVQTQLFGRFWRDAVVAAAAIGHHFDVDNQDIISAIADYQPKSLRSQLLAWRGHKVWLDCYNANPSSVAAFMEAVADDSAARAILVLGEMLELGEYERAEHLDILAKAAELRLEALILVGQAFAGLPLPSGQALHFEQAATAGEWLTQQAAGAHIYVKGSRGNKLEQIFL